MGSDTFGYLGSAVQVSGTVSDTPNTSMCRRRSDLSHRTQAGAKADTEALFVMMCRKNESRESRRELIYKARFVATRAQPKVNFR
jgi:hypothetical protein